MPVAGTLRKKTSVRAAKGFLHRYEFEAETLGGTTTAFAIFLPDICDREKLPVLYWLSGLTCTDENFCQKAGAFQAASEQRVVLVMPDTSPRGESVPDEDPKTYDFGVGAGFYLRATTSKYSKHYNMYDFVLEELDAVVRENFPVNGLRSISGHSMGGHGALTLALKNPEKFVSVSAFSPICNPTNCPWGQKAFQLYLGDDRDSWKQYDATELIKNYRGPDLRILCDMGTADSFLVGEVDQLQPLKFLEACREAGAPVTFRMQAGYDHSYYFISSFIEEHIAHHARHLHAGRSAL